MFISFSKLTARLRAVILNFSDDKLGHNYGEYKGTGQKAVNHLLETKEGQVRGAFFSYALKDCIGNGEIDIVWGEVFDSKEHTGYGIAHILDKHGIKAVNMIGEIIERGIPRKASNGRYKIRYKNYSVIISPEWNGEKRNVIVTCYDKGKDKRN